MVATARTNSFICSSWYDDCVINSCEYFKRAVEVLIFFSLHRRLFLFELHGCDSVCVLKRFVCCKNGCASRLFYKSILQDAHDVEELNNCGKQVTTTEDPHVSQFHLHAL